MRIRRVLTILALLFLTACHRAKDCCGPAIQPSLTGNWSLISVEGGLTAGRIVPADSPVILTLNNDSTYHVQARMIVVESGTFHLTDTPLAALSNIIQPVIVFSAGIAPLGLAPQVYTLSHDTLFLGTSAYDGLAATYVKID